MDKHKLQYFKTNDKNISFSDLIALVFTRAEDLAQENIRLTKEIEELKKNSSKKQPETKSAYDIDAEIRSKFKH